MKRKEIIYLAEGMAVPDNDSLQVVVMTGIFDPATRKSDNALLAEAENIVRYCHGKKRIHKNMLALVVRGEKVIEPELEADYYYLLLPERCPADGEMLWAVTRFINYGDLKDAVFRQLKAIKAVHFEASPAMLRDMAEKSWFTRGYVKISDLWRHCTANCGAARFYDYSVLTEAIRLGVRQRYFAYASGERSCGRHFFALRYGAELRAAEVLLSGVLVLKRKAYRQLMADYCIRKAYALLSRGVYLLPLYGRAILGNILGWLFWVFSNPVKKQDAVQRVQNYLKVEELAAREIARRSILGKGRMLADLLYAPRHNADSIGEVMEFENIHYLETALAKGQGVILVSAHLGNWETAAMALAHKKYPVSFVYSATKHTLGGELLTKHRLLAGMSIIEKNKVRDMIRALKAGRLLIMAIDQAGGATGAPVSFFNDVFFMPRGVSKINGSPIVPAFSVEKAPCRYKLVFHEPVCRLELGNEEETDSGILQKLIGIIEDQVRKYPQEWLWFYNPWKIRKNN